MPTPTQQELFKAAYESKGYRQVPCRSGKYIQMQKPRDGNEGSGVYNIFLGKAGAVRAGGNASSSLPVPFKIRKHMLTIGQGLLTK